jgi:hypothetical protein
MFINKDKDRVYFDVDMISALHTIINPTMKDFNIESVCFTGGHVYSPMYYNNGNCNGREHHAVVLMPMKCEGIEEKLNNL